MGEPLTPVPHVNRQRLPRQPSAALPACLPIKRFQMLVRFTSQRCLPFSLYDNPGVWFASATGRCTATLSLRGFLLMHSTLEVASHWFEVPYSEPFSLPIVASDLNIAGILGWHMPAVCGAPHRIAGNRHYSNRYYIEGSTMA